MKSEQLVKLLILISSSWLSQLKKRKWFFQKGRARKKASPYEIDQRIRKLKEEQLKKQQAPHL